MKEDNSKTIIFLLAAILAVMLFGASAVLSGFLWFAAIAAVLGVIVLVGCLVVFGLANLTANITKRYTAQARFPPYEWSVEQLTADIIAAIKWLPKLPGQFARLVVLPVIEFRRCWQFFRERRARGERMGIADLEILSRFVATLFAWFVGGILVVFFVSFAVLIVYRIGLTLKEAA